MELRSELGPPSQCHLIREYSNQYNLPHKLCRSLTSVPFDPLERALEKPKQLAKQSPNRQLVGTAERREVLEHALTSGSFVQHTQRAIPKERLQDAFNTPFFPMVLVWWRLMCG